MMSVKLTHLVTFFAFFLSVVHAQQKASTDDGRTVILNTDGTWRYAEAETKSASTDFDFRKASWGMTKKQVKPTEELKVLSEDESILAYNGTVSGMDAVVGYVFADGNLVRTQYRFAPEHTNKNDFLLDYKRLKETLTSKYGPPKSDDVNWRNDLYRNDYDNWGFAVSLGHLTYLAQWGTDRTDISLFLSGDNYKINLVVEYRSKTLGHLEEKAQQKKKETEF